MLNRATTANGNGSSIRSAIAQGIVKAASHRSNLPFSLYQSANGITMIINTTQTNTIAKRFGTRIEVTLHPTIENTETAKYTRAISRWKTSLALVFKGGCACCPGLFKG